MKNIIENILNKSIKAKVGSIMDAGRIRNEYYGKFYKSLSCKQILKCCIDNCAFENEKYVVQAEGEMLIDRKFVVYKSSMKFWEPPHEKEQLSLSQIEHIINEVRRNTNENTVQLIFE